MFILDYLVQLINGILSPYESNVFLTTNYVYFLKLSHEIKVALIAVSI